MGSNDAASTGGSYRFRAELWLHQGDAAWHFVTVPAGDDVDVVLTLVDV